MRIFTIGETTYDISFRDGLPVGACSGGSAYNSAISLGRCGLPVSLISTFGNDTVGDLSSDFLLKNGVNCDLIKRFDGQSRIALAFFDPDNNLLGSSFALRDNGRENLIGFLQMAKDLGCIIIYDPNARQLVTDQPDIVNKILQNIALATIIKGSDEDFRNIFGLNDGESVYSLISDSGKKVLVYTRGADGAELFTRDFHFTIAAKETKVVSTIGAGDNFSAGIVYGLYNHMIDNILFEELTPDSWEGIMNSGILFASEVCGSSQNYLSEETGTRLQSDLI
jgi:fructokinase